MRFMVMIKASPISEAETEPSPDDGVMLAMGRYNEALVAAGVMRDGAGLMPTAKGARVEVTPEGPLVTDGPFAEIKDVIAGFWIWECASLAEAIAWVGKCPVAYGQNRFEVRQLYEMDDFGTEGEGIEQHRKVAEQLAAQGH